MLPEWKTGKVVDIINETHNTKRFFIEISGVQNFEFQPGQFVTLDLPIHEQKHKRRRSYSIASAPNGTNVIELIIVKLQGGLGTGYLFNLDKVQAGIEFPVCGPQGKFVLPEKPDKNLFLICTETGIAPFRSMALHLYRQKTMYTNVHLIAGCPKFTDALYFKEMSELAKAEKNFYYHPVFLMEEQAPENAYTGCVHQAYEQLLAGEKQAALFYLCGWKNMIDEAKERIANLGYDKKDIHWELYG